MKNKIYFFFVAFFLIISATAFPQSKAELIDMLISKYSEYGYFNGSALVADNFSVVFEKGYGFANMEWGIPNKPDTKHRLGSVTKQFTSMLIMQLVEKGKIKLDGKISDYLSYYRKDTGGKVTIEMLLTHTSGVPSYTNREDFAGNIERKYFTPDDFVKEYCSGDLEFEPGSQFAYDNSGYFILGAIIEKVTNKKYADVLKQNIFDPLGMNNTGYDYSETILTKRAAGYEKEFLGYKNAAMLDMSLPYAAGSLYSTVEDLLLWDKALQTEKLLSKKNLDEIFKGRQDAYGSKYGFGWTIAKKKINDVEYNVIAHGGGINGFNTINYMIPEKGEVVILLSNAGGAPLNEITVKIIDILNGKEIVMPKQSLARRLYSIIQSDGIDKALSQFKSLKSEREAFDLKENEINDLGYELIRGNKIKEAVAILKLNTLEFPKSFNVYDSYAEVLLLDGNQDEAITNYKKSIELNPNNTSGIKALKNLGVTIEKKKAVEFSAEVLNQYAGKYQLAPNFIIAVTVNGKQIFVQATGQPKFEVFAESETKFFLKAVEAKVEFIKTNGKVTGLNLMQNGGVMPAKKID